MNIRAWLACAAWACLAGIAGQFFVAVAFVGLILLFFGAMLSAVLLPLLAWLPGDWQATGGQWLALVMAVWLVALLVSGAVARWAWRRCRAVRLEPAPLVLELPDGQAVRPVMWSGARRSSVLVGLVASLLFYVVVPAWFWSGVNLSPWPRPGPPAGSVTV